MGFILKPFKLKQFEIQQDRCAMKIGTDSVLLGAWTSLQNNPNSILDEIEDTYDLIISNPPFYSEDYKTENSQRDLARFSDALPFEQLLKSVSKLLSENGSFSVIIPYNKEDKFISLASESNLFPNRILHVKGNPDSEFKRSLLEFSFFESKPEIKDLIIETARHQYTEDYIQLTKDFYLKM